jgi:hypothetical protein
MQEIERNSSSFEMIDERYNISGLKKSSFKLEKFLT